MFLGKKLICQQLKNCWIKRAEDLVTKKITAEDISKAGFKTIDELATSLSEGKINMTKIKPLKPWFALSPPRQGFKRSTKRLYGQKGILGHNKELTTLVKRMM